MPNNNLSTISVQLGNITNKNFLKVMADQYNNKPWMVLRYVIDQLEAGKMYSGTIVQGAYFSYIGLKVSDTYASFLVFSYSGMWRVWNLNGTWYYKALDEGTTNATTF